MTKKALLSHKFVLLTAFISLCIVGLYAASLGDPSDAGLTRQFLRHQPEFEKLVKMAEEDTHVIRIAGDFTWLDTDVSWPRKDVGISDQRWEQYRTLFRKAGVPNGISKDPESFKVFFPIASRGLVPTGQEKGIVYSRAALTPVLKSLDQTPPAELYEKGHVLVFKPIKGHWYLYYQEW